MLGEMDLSEYSADDPLPNLPPTELAQSRQKLLVDLARRENLTIRQLYLSIAGARGHRQILGTPSQIADQLEEWFLNNAADGFSIMPPYLPDGLNEFVDWVIPELQRRSLFRTSVQDKSLQKDGRRGFHENYHIQTMNPCLTDKTKKLECG